jgi:hypothetical protein
MQAEDAAAVVKKGAAAVRSIAGEEQTIEAVGTVH